MKKTYDGHSIYYGDLHRHPFASLTAHLRYQEKINEEIMTIGIIPIARIEYMGIMCTDLHLCCLKEGPHLHENNDDHDEGG